MTADIVVVGPITADLSFQISSLPPADGSIHADRVQEAVGGKGAYAAIACAQLGAHTSLIGAVGADKLGKRLRKQLKGHGVDVSMVQRRPDQSTGRIVHLIEPDGQHSFIESAGANDDLQVDTDLLEKSMGADGWMLLSTALPVAPLVAAAEVARKAGASVALDLTGPAATSEQLLRYSSVVRADADEAAALTGSEVTDFDTAATAARWLQIRGANVAVVQAGALGDLLRFGTTEVQIPRRPVTAVDPTGAGDAFVATLVVRLALGDEPTAAATLASAAAGHTVGQLGGTPRFDLSALESA